MEVSANLQTQSLRPPNCERVGRAVHSPLAASGVAGAEGGSGVAGEQVEAAFLSESIWRRLAAAAA